MSIKNTAGADLILGGFILLIIVCISVSVVTATIILVVTAFRWMF